MKPFSKEIKQQDLFFEPALPKKVEKSSIDL